MPADISWGNLVKGTVSAADAEPLITRAAGELEKVLAEHPSAEQDVRLMLEKVFSQGVGRRTWARTTLVLASYLGDEPAQLVTWIAGDDDQLKQLRAVEAWVSRKVVAFIRTILGYFGSELQTAYRVTIVFPDDWANLEREVFTDLPTGRWLIRHRIRKFSGEEVLLECAPNSFANLLVFLMGTLPTLKSAAVLGEDQRKRIATRAQEVVRFVEQPKSDSDVTPKTTKG